jgi:hypothetical protein
MSTVDPAAGAGDRRTPAPAPPARPRSRETTRDSD